MVEKRADMQGAVVAAVVVVMVVVMLPPRAPHATLSSRCAMGLFALLTWAAPLAMPLTAHDQPHSSRIGTAQQACEMHPLTHQWAPPLPPSQVIVRKLLAAVRPRVLLLVGMRTATYLWSLSRPKRASGYCGLHPLRDVGEGRGCPWLSPSPWPAAFRLPHS